MSTNTTNYALVKADIMEIYDVNLVNANLDTVDTTLFGKVDKVAGQRMITTAEGDKIANTYGKEETYAKSETYSQAENNTLLSVKVDNSNFQTTLENIGAQLNVGKVTKDILLLSSTSHAPNAAFGMSGPFYFAYQDNLRGKYITKIAFKATQYPSTMKIIFKNVQNATSIAVGDYAVDGSYCTITTSTAAWTEYDLTGTDSRVVLVNENLTDGKIFIPASGRIIGIGEHGSSGCYTAYCGTVKPVDNSQMAFISPMDSTVNATYSLAFDIKTTVTESKKSFLDGKYLSIIGDSISTYKGWIPYGNADYYTGSVSNVTSMSQTWWGRLLAATGMNLLVNNAWGGSGVTTIGGETPAGCMTRTAKLHAAIKPDIIIILMGTNDFSAEVALGTYDGNSAFPTVTTTFREAYAIMLSKIMANYPLAKIYCATLTDCEKNGTTTDFPEKNDNGVLLSQWNDAIKDTAYLFGANVIDFWKCGINHFNLSIYAGDYNAGTKFGLHPNAAGHRLMANQAIKEIAPTLMYDSE